MCCNIGIMKILAKILACRFQNSSELVSENPSMVSGGLRKGGAPVQIKWGGPFLYALL